VAPPSSQTVGKRLFLPHRLRQLFSALHSYYERSNTAPSLRIGSYLHRLSTYISSREASLTSASLVPLTEHNLPTAEFDFTSACEDWARSYNLDIFNDLVEPFQTRPTPLVPVQQGGVELPVHQGNSLVPVHQGSSLIPVHQGDSVAPVHQVAAELSGQQRHAAAPGTVDFNAQHPSEPLALLPNLPAIEGLSQPLPIGAPPQRHSIVPPQERELDVVLRDRTPSPEPQYIPLPPSPPSFETTLHDVPVEATSKEISVPDAFPFFPQRDFAPYAGSDSTRPSIDSLDTHMSPGNTAPPPKAPAFAPEAAGRHPSFDAAMADELQRLRAELNQVRAVQQNESQELQHLRGIQAANLAALQRAEASYQEEYQRRQELEDAAAQRTLPRITAGLAASRHAPVKGKEPSLGEAGPSSWQQPQRPSGSGYTQGSVPPLFARAPNPPPPDLSSNPFLRVPDQQGWQPPQQPPYQQPPQQPPGQHPPYHPPPPAQLPLFQQPLSQQPPQQQPPPPSQTDILTELAQLQAFFARNQHAVNERLLGALADRDPGGAPRGPTLAALKASDIGMFEPTAVPDPDAAIVFLDNIRDAVRQYGEERVMLVMKRCCTNAVALGWLTGLELEDRDELITSAAAWDRLIRRDFMPDAEELEAKARDDLFKWSQGRSASQYVTDKIRLLRIAGITNPDAVVHELHKGFRLCPELKMHLHQYVKRTGNDLSLYRREVLRYQEMAKMQYDFIRRNPGNHPYAPRSLPPATGSSSSTNTDGKRQFPQSRPQPSKDRVRKRKCRNFPSCGDGEHWDFQCTMKPPARDTRKRAYYVMPENESDELVLGQSSCELVDEDWEIEREYANDQAYFTAAAQLETGFFGSGNPVAKSPDRRTTPKPSECRACREAFPSRSQLHAHLALSGHNRFAAKHVEIVKSKRSPSVHPEARLASYHYAEARFLLRPDDIDSRVCCMDSGYGNSAVDASFVAAHIPNPRYHALTEPKEVRGIGGGVALCSKLLMLTFYFPTMDGKCVELSRAFHVFPDLGVDLLCGIDTIREEGIDMFYSSTIPQMRIASCLNAAVRIDVRDGAKMTRIPVRTATTTVVPANSTAIVAIKTSRNLPANQDYLFTPSKLKSVSASGSGAPHAVVSHDQKNILFTNLHDTDVTLFRNTVIGYLHSTGSEEVAVWHEAAKEVRGFLGFAKIAKACTAALAFAATAASQTFDPDADSAMPLPGDLCPSPLGLSADSVPPTGGPQPADGPSFPFEPPRPRPCPVTSAEALPDAACAAEQWSPPTWLQEQYFPRYEYDLPAGIKVPDVSTTTYAQVVVNESDDISPEQIAAIRQLVARHPHLFNDGMGCVREPEEDWMRLPVDREYELKLKPRGPYRLSRKAEHAVDCNFDDLHLHGRLEWVTKATPWGLQVFVVFKGDKERPVIDMRRLNDGLAGDSYPLPRMESVIEPLKGMRWLGTVDITSAFYQRLLHPDDRHRTAVVTHRGVEQFATTVMGCKNSVQHQQKLMDKRVLSKLSWRGASCYVDDIVIYAANFQDFLQMADEVFRILSDLGITLKARKCYLGFHSIELLGYLVDRLGLTTTEAKSDAVARIPFPATLAQLEYFIGLTNWNRHLVPYYAQRVAPLQACKTALLKPAPLTKRARKIYAAKTPVPKDDVLVQAFEDLKEALASRPRLHHFEDGRPIYAFLDTSREYGTGLAVYQLTGDPDTYCKTRLVPLHFLSKRLTPAEANYWPTDMELSGLVWSTKKLRPYMERSFVWFVTDHKPNVDIFDMKSLQTSSTSRSNLRLQTWGIYLSQFWGRMQVVYSKGAQLDCPDALSRLQYTISDRAQRLRDWATELGKAPETDEFEVTEAFAITRSAKQTMAPERSASVQPRDSPTAVPDRPPPALTPSMQPDAHSDSTQPQNGLTIVASASQHALLRDAVAASKRFSAIHQRLMTEGTKSEVSGEPRYALVDTCQYVLHGGLLYLLDPVTSAHRLVLANASLQKSHLSAAHGESHHGCARMMDALKSYYWPGMSAAVRNFLKHCPDCLRNKPANHRPFGLLSPVPTPHEPFETWSIDLITDLPVSFLDHCDIAFDTVMTVTDKYTKAVRFLPGRKDWSAAEWAKVVYEGVTLNGWGYPRTLISDRDRRFLSALWNSILELAGTRHVTTTAYHPSADGQAERTNFALEVSLRFFVNESQNDWVAKLKVIEAQTNNTLSASTKQAPNEILYGKKVRLNLTASLSELPPDADELSLRREAIREDAARAIAFAQKAMKESYDRRRESGSFETGWAFLKIGHGYSVPGIQKPKLGPQRIGPFRITEVISKGRAYRLDLPPHYKIHDVISIVHLEPAPCPGADPYQRKTRIEDLTPVYRDGQEEWELDALVKKRTTGRASSKTVEYLGRWKGYGPEWDTWLKLSELDNAKELVKAFEDQQTLAKTSKEAAEKARQGRKTKQRVRKD
jgi:hypothetical protein